MKKCLQLFTNLFTSPIKTFKKKDDLRWAQMIIYFFITAFVVRLPIIVPKVMDFLVAHHYMKAPIAPIETKDPISTFLIIFPILQQIICLLLTAWVGSTVLKQRKIKIECKELAEAIFKGAIFSLVLSFILRLALFDTVVYDSTKVIGILGTTLFLTFLNFVVNSPIVISVFIYLRHTKKLSEKRAAIISVLLWILFFFIPVAVNKAWVVLQAAAAKLYA